MQSRLEERIGDDVFGMSIKTTLEDVVCASSLRKNGLTVHVTEAGLPGVISGAWNDDTDSLRSKQI